MKRKIVLIRRHEPLHEGWSTRSFSPAAAHLESNVKVAGAYFDERFPPVRLVGRFPADGSPSLQPPAVMVVPGMRENVASAYIVRASVEDENAVARLVHDRDDEVLGVFADVPIGPVPTCGNDPAVGSASDVRAKLDVQALRTAGCTGRGTRTVIVDSGVNDSVIPVAGGWSPIAPGAPGYLAPGAVRPPSGDWRHHGTMCAFDARIAAPDTAIYDYRLLTGTQASFGALLSDAITAFGELFAFLQANPGPLVVNNSWCLFNRGDDEPTGSPQNYGANLNHPFNQIVATLVAAGADVLFAAGNCGADCPDGRCGPGDVGTGNSIHGASAHPDVLTVAALTVNDERLGYSSQGPGGIAMMKPDLAGYSHFAGSGVFPADSGTSAACPVVAGVVAALRERLAPNQITPPQLKALLQRTARDLGGVGFDYDYGHGAVNPPGALAMLGF